MRMVLVTLSKIIAPFTPFIAEEIYQGLGTKGASLRSESVHLEQWPVVDEALVNAKLEEDMESVRSIVEMAHSLRSESGMRVRQPLAQLVCNTQMSDELYAIIADEVNVKSAGFQDSDVGDGWIAKENGALRVALNTILTPELKEEGIVRELIRHINALRKEQGLTPKDIIALQWDSANVDLARIAQAHKGEIMTSVIAQTMVQGTSENMHAMTLGEGDIRLGLTKID